jgi:hypothetical protein
MNQRNESKLGVKNPAPKRRVKAEKTPLPHPSREVAFVACNVGFASMPNEEFGPMAVASYYQEDQSSTDILALSVLQSASAPKWRPWKAIGGKKVVFVVSDTVLQDAAPRAVATTRARSVGTYTEAKRLADQVRWLCLAHNYSTEELAEIAAAEVELVIKETPGLCFDEVMFIVWASFVGSFGGATALELGRAIAAEAFTAAEIAKADLSDDDE